MGRKKKDYRLKLLDGTAKEPPKLQSEPGAAGGMWKSPSWLGEYGREYHLAHWHIADAMGRITEADRCSWFNLCQRWQRIREAEAAIDEHGVLMKGRVKNPACTVLKSEQEAFRRERQIFGLDPESREKLGVKIEKPSKMAGFVDL
jgi:P27 family predicted phage terminase small subunit